MTGSYMRVTIGSQILVGRLEMATAPFTCAAFRTMAPLRHAGEARSPAADGRALLRGRHYCTQALALG